MADSVIINGETAPKMANGHYDLGAVQVAFLVAGQPADFDDWTPATDGLVVLVGPRGCRDGERVLENAQLVYDWLVAEHSPASSHLVV